MTRGEWFEWIVFGLLLYACFMGFFLWGWVAK
jgi:hypothetical protein